MDMTTILFALSSKWNTNPKINVNYFSNYDYLTENVHFIIVTQNPRSWIGLSMYLLTIRRTDRICIMELSLSCNIY